MTETVAQNLVAIDFASKLSDLVHQLADLQCRVSSLEHVLSDAEGKLAFLRPPRTEVEPSARVVSKLERVTFYRPLEVHDTIPGFALSGEASRSGPEVFHRDASVLLEELQVGTKLPESILNYSLTRLISSKRPWRDPALVYLLVLVTSQQLLMGTFMISSDVHADTNYIKGPEMSVMSCALADAWMFSGESMTKVATACISMFLIACMLKTDDVEHFELFHYLRHEHELGWALWSFVTLVWFIQIVYLPALFCTDATLLFASAADATEIIMNGLAMVYIMEIDNTLYLSLLSSEEKAAYQRESQNLIRTCAKQRQLTWYARSLFIVSMAFMLFSYAFSMRGFSFLQDMPSSSYMFYVLIFVWNILHGCRSAAIFSMLQTPNGDEWIPLHYQSFRRVCSTCLIFMLTPLISGHWGQFTTWLLTGDAKLESTLLRTIPKCIERAKQG